MKIFLVAQQAAHNHVRFFLTLLLRCFSLPES